MAPSSRSRTIFSCTGRSNIGEQSDLHKLYPSPPFHKSFAELFQKRPFPPFPSFPLSFPLYPPANQMRPVQNRKSIRAERRAGYTYVGVAIDLRVVAKRLAGYGPLPVF